MVASSSPSCCGHSLMASKQVSWHKFGPIHRITTRHKAAHVLTIHVTCCCVECACCKRMTVKTEAASTSTKSSNPSLPSLLPQSLPRRTTSVKHGVYAPSWFLKAECGWLQHTSTKPGK